MNHIVSVNNVSKNYNLAKWWSRLCAGSPWTWRGRVLAIAGPSGSGKTTLLNLWAAWIPSAGTVTVDGKQTGLLSERNLTRLRLNTIGFIFKLQSGLRVSVLQNVELQLLLQRTLKPRERQSGARAC